MMCAPAVRGAAEAAAARARCHAAAVALQHTPRRAQLAWHDLAAWPSWATTAADDAAALDALAWTVGVFWYAAAWQSCIDGPRLQHLSQRLGAAAFDALMGTEQPHPIDTPLPQGRDADDALTDCGREVLLAALPAPALRVVLREMLWPQSLPPVPAPAQAAAQKVVTQALHAHEPSHALHASEQSQALHANEQSQALRAKEQSQALHPKEQPA
jgi:hypothetical protein